MVTLLGGDYERHDGYVHYLDSVYVSWICTCVKTYQIKLQAICQLYPIKLVFFFLKKLIHPDCKRKRENTEKYYISHNSIRADWKQHCDNVFLPVFSLYTDINNI